MADIQQAIPVYGEKLLQTLKADLFEKCGVFCAGEAWDLVKDEFLSAPEFVVVPESMEESVLKNQIESLSEVKSVFGIGGGSACDAAKMAGWMKGIPLILMPSIVSVDAAFTSAVGVRVNHHVRYVGQILPEKLLIDFNLLKRSPKRLNRAGVGDILSIFTALYDWKLAADTIGEEYNPAIANDSKKLLEDLLQKPKEVHACDNEGLKLISELYVAEVYLCEKHGNSRPEEGSEHYFAYCLESITHRSYIHGELIALSILVAALYQNQDVAKIKHFLDEAGVLYKPDQIDVTESEIMETLLMLPDFLAQETQLPYGIFHHRGMNKRSAKDILDKLKSLLG